VSGGREGVREGSAMDPCARFSQEIGAWKMPLLSLLNLPFKELISEQANRVCTEAYDLTQLKVQPARQVLYI